MNKAKNGKLIDGLISRYPELEVCKSDIELAAEILLASFKNGKKLLICGNGGSSSDSDHIVGELMKSFSKKREISPEVKNSLINIDSDSGQYLAEKLQGSLPAISLSAHSGLTSAVANDIDADLIFAQQVLGYAKKGDVLIGISTSGNSKNVVNAAITAKAMEMKVIALVGNKKGTLNNYCDVAIEVPSGITPFIQEYHLPIYHVLCKIVEENLF
ncbi:MAG: SIS domain-containing protein [Bacteroidota bacterium]